MDSNDFNSDTRRRIAEMLEKIHCEKLLNRIYRFVKYIYLHRDGEPSRTCSSSPGRGVGKSWA